MTIWNNLKRKLVPRRSQHHQLTIDHYSNNFITDYTQPTTVSSLPSNDRYFPPFIYGGNYTAVKSDMNDHLSLGFLLLN